MLLDSLARAGFSIDCTPLIKYKPMKSSTLDVYQQRADEFTSQVILENFALTMTKNVSKILKKELLEVNKYVD